MNPWTRLLHDSRNMTIEERGVLYSSVSQYVYASVLTDSQKIQIVSIDDLDKMKKKSKDFFDYNISLREGNNKKDILNYLEYTGSYQDNLEDIIEEARTQFLSNRVSEALEIALFEKFKDPLNQKLLASTNDFSFILEDDDGFLSGFVNGLTSKHLKDLQQFIKIDAINYVDVSSLLHISYDLKSEWIRDVRIPSIVNTFYALFNTFDNLHSSHVQKTLDILYGACNYELFYNNDEYIVSNYTRDFKKMVSDQSSKYHDSDFFKFMTNDDVIYQLWCFVSYLLIITRQYLMKHHFKSYSELFAFIRPRIEPYTVYQVWDVVKKAFKKIIFLTTFLNGNVNYINPLESVNLLNSILNTNKMVLTSNKNEYLTTVIQEYLGQNLNLTDARTIDFTAYLDVYTNSLFENQNKLFRDKITLSRFQYFL